MIYISGPMSGDFNYRQKFDRAENYLVTHYKVVTLNPARVLDSLPSDHISQEQLMGLCLYLLDTCDSIYLLRGWSDSYGARTEYNFAVKHDKNIIFQK